MARVVSLRPRPRRWGIRARVVASFLVLLIAAEAVSLVVLHQVGTRRIDQQADLALATAAEDLRARLDAAGRTLGQAGGPTVAEIFTEHLRARPNRRDQATIAYVGGEPFAASAEAPVRLQDLPISATWARTATSTSGTEATAAGPARWLAVPVLAGGESNGPRTVGVLVVAEFTGSRLDALEGTVLTVSVVTFLILAGASLLAWSAAGRALAPVRELALAARSVSGSDDLSARVDVTGHDEVADLARSVNVMMENLQTAFDSQRRFLDTAAHELRTPLTIIRGHVELLDDEPRRRAEEITLVLDEIDRMDRLVEELRVLARSERPDFLVWETVDTADLVAETGRKASALADRCWLVEPGPSTLVRGDRQRLTQALLNLVHNAVHVTEADDRIAIRARAGADEVTLQVIDTGPGMDPEHLPSLFQQEGRTIRPRPGGTGLGLPLVRAIALAHGGDVSVTSVPGAGSEFCLTVPRRTT